MVLSVGDRVKSRATLYDAGTEDEDGLTFSQRQLGKGLGAFCFGEVTHVYRKVGRQSQKYRVKWDSGEVSQVLSEHLELVSVVEGSSDVGGGTDIDEATDYDRFVTVDGEETDDEGEGEQEVTEVGEVTRVGGVVEVGEVKWKRIENITRDVREGQERFDLQVKPFVVNALTSEKELFWLCMPVSRDKLVDVVRSRAGFTSSNPPSYALPPPLHSPPLPLSRTQRKAMTSTGNGQLTPSTSSCDAFLEVPSTRCAPYFPLFWAYLTLPSTHSKVGTDLWATEDKGMVRAPDFGRILSKDRCYSYP